MGIKKEDFDMMEARLRRARRKRVPLWPEFRQSKPAMAYQDEADEEKALHRSIITECARSWPSGGCMSGFFSANASM